MPLFVTSKLQAADARPRDRQTNKDQAEKQAETQNKQTRDRQHRRQSAKNCFTVGLPVQRIRAHMTRHERAGYVSICDSSRKENTCSRIDKDIVELVAEQ